MACPPPFPFERRSYRPRRGLLRELGEPPLEEAALGVGVRQLERPRVRDARLRVAAEPAQAVRARRVEVVIAGELELVEQREPRAGPVRLGDGDGAVQLDDRRAGSSRSSA